MQQIPSMLIFLLWEILDGMIDAMGAKYFDIFT